MEKAIVEHALGRTPPEERCSPYGEWSEVRRDGSFELPYPSPVGVPLMMASHNRFNWAVPTTRAENIMAGASMEHVQRTAKRACRKFWQRAEHDPGLYANLLVAQVHPTADIDGLWDISYCTVYDEREAAEEKAEFRGTRVIDFSE